ncbi:MAG: pyridoxal phosphate-dependent aminotransferase [Cyanobacteria bacterium SBLK]|nr:pyridoxal phosphate-dependent aminotransferase [Cyanobacteria bacterium SBLK]
MNAKNLQSDAEQLLSLFVESNPNVINLSVAENILLFDRLQEIFCPSGPLARLKAIFSQNSSCIELSDIKYQSSHGEQALRGAIAQFLNNSFSLNPSLGYEQVSCLSSTRCALETAIQALFSDIELSERKVLIPTPYWQGFDWIYEKRWGGEIIPVPLIPDDNFALTLSKIEEAYNGADSEPKAIVLTNPNNPLGINYDKALLEEIFTWILKNTEMHIFSDEIYAHCQTQSYPSGFVSALALPLTEVEEECRKQRVHVAWGFAKDFGLSGFRVGVVASHNEELQAGIRSSNRAYFSPMTSSNNWFISKIFARPGQAKELMDEMIPLLAERLQEVNNALDSANIPYFQDTNAAQFIWLDLRQWLGQVPPPEKKLKNWYLLDYLKAYLRDKYKEEEELQCFLEEEKLFEYLEEVAMVSLLPGSTLSNSVPGYFRLCFTAEDRTVVLQAIQQIAAALEPYRPSASK